MKKIFKNIIALSLIFLFTLNIKADDSLKWHEFKDGLAKAKKENKILLVDFYTDWCGWCKKMDASTYKDSKVVNYLKENFVIVKLNPEKDGSVHFQGNEYKLGEFAAAAGVNGFPATGFFTSNSEFIRTFPGYMDADSFLDLLQKLVQAVKVN